MEKEHSMAMNREFLGQNSLSKTIFEKVPCGLLVMDSRRQLQQVNGVLEKTFGITRKQALGKCLGEALGCNDFHQSGVACGKGSICGECALWKAADQALVHNRSCKVQVNFHRKNGGSMAQENPLMFHAVPFEHEGERFALLQVDKLSISEELPRNGHPERSSEILGRHPTFQEMVNLLEEAAQTDLPVLLQGESGTGKELAAQAIHEWSNRKDQPFIAVNCAALPHGLLESELFGHVKGAFTDAIRDKKGRFELADGGTLFLDEIGELAPEFQVKLLRVVQEGCFEPIGGTVSKKVNVRLVSATNKNLQQEMNRGNFRLDLFYRLCVVPITVPPLRERASDIPLLAQEFLHKFGRDHGLAKSLSPAVLEIFQKYGWPGNIRELQNVIQFAMMKCSGTTIGRHHLPSHLLQETIADRLYIHKKIKLTKQEVLTALAKNNGNKMQAAKDLGVARATFYRFIKNRMAGMPDPGRGATYIY